VVGNERKKVGNKRKMGIAMSDDATKRSASIIALAIELVEIILYGPDIAQIGRCSIGLYIEHL
jgi:hypothetical protein